MKKIVCLFSFWIFLLPLVVSCNIFGESAVDSDFVFALPQDGLGAWYDASRTDQIDMDGSGIMSFWRDRYYNFSSSDCSGSNVIFQESLRNMRGGLFVGTANPGCTLNHSGGVAENTIFVAMQINDTSSSHSVVGNFVLDPTSSSGGYQDTCIMPDNPAGALVATIRLDPTTTVTQQIYLNGTFQCSTSAGTAFVASPTLGMFVPIGTFFFEIIIYERLLEDHERKAIENYLMSKWDIGNISD